ncbi:MAG: type I 3-dehydroquinate dehydratase [Candidatus Methanomethyliaceae archaeon]
MVCVSIGDVTVDDCLRILEEVEFAEIRMDRLEIKKKDVKRIFSAHKNLVATFKEGHAPQKKREDFLIEAIEQGAAYVDVDLNSPKNFFLRVSRKAREKGTKLIVSYHNFERTDSLPELIEIASLCLSTGDYGKISCMVNEDEDNLSLLKLLKIPEFKGKIIVIGMGEKGKITRILSPILGSPFTFACYKKGKEMAEGQVQMDTLSEMLSLLLEAKGCGSTQ